MAKEDVDVDVVLVVVVAGGPCLSNRRKSVVWTKRRTMTSFLVRRKGIALLHMWRRRVYSWKRRVLFRVFMDGMCSFMERMCLVS